MSAIERCDVADTKSFCRGDHRCVCGPERKISILGNEFGDSQPVAREYRLREEVSCGKVAEETHFGVSAETCAEEVGDLGDDECRDDEWSGVAFEQVQACGVVPVVAIDVGVEGAGVDDQRDGRTSLARISSIRSEMSSRPLAPAPAASSCRLPGWAPSKFSIASRVSSDTVLPRRSASWRRRASSSSGSFTVVRCMYASILDQLAGWRPCVLERQGVDRQPAGPLSRPVSRSRFRLSGSSSSVASSSTGNHRSSATSSSPHSSPDTTLASNTIETYEHRSPLG